MSETPNMLAEAVERVKGCVNALEHGEELQWLDGRIGSIPVKADEMAADLRLILSALPAPEGGDEELAKRLEAQTRVVSAASDHGSVQALLDQAAARLRALSGGRGSSSARSQPCGEASADAEVFAGLDAEPSASDWRPWSGGARPVSAGTRVDIRLSAPCYADETQTEFLNVRAGDWAWPHDDYADPWIIAWRPSVTRVLHEGAPVEKKSRDELKASSND